MALTIELQVSETGVAEAAFSPLTILPDTGSGFTYDHTPVTPGRLYIYRARRHDDTKSGACAYSDWTLYFVRAPYPNRSKRMNAEDVRTGAESAVYFGLERFQGIPHKVQDIGAYLSGDIGHELTRVFSRQLRNAPTMRRKVVAGRVTFEGELEVEVSPEGFFPRMLCATMPVTTDNLSTPTRYLHTWKNAFGAVSGTLVIKKGASYFVYPGCRVTGLEISPDAESDNALMAKFTLVALDKLVFTVARHPTLLADLGIASAAEDALDIYSHQSATGYIEEVEAGVRTSTWNFSKNLGKRKVQDGKRGISGTFERLAETSGSASLYYEDDINLERDFGVDAPTTGYGPGEVVLTAPVEVVFTPPENASGFSNELTMKFPQADIKTSQGTESAEEIPESLTFAPIDAIGESDGTDFLLTLVNEQSNADLTTPADPFVGTTTWDAMTAASKSKKYEYGKASGTPTTTVIAMAANLYLSATNDIYVGRTLKCIKSAGAALGQERTITDYVGSSRTFTVSAVFGAAPAAGDIFVII